MSAPVRPRQQHGVAKKRIVIVPAEGRDSPVCSSHRAAARPLRRYTAISRKKALNLLQSSRFIARGHPDGHGQQIGVQGMAIRRAKQKAQVIAKLSASAPAGETFMACVHGETGPSPWLNGLFDEIPFLGLIVALTRRYYFFTLTNTSVVVNGANRLTNRPGEIAAVFPRSAFPVTRYKRGSVWSRFYLQLPGSAKPTRINVHRYWRADLDQLAIAFPAEAGAAAAVGAVPGEPAIG